MKIREIKFTVEAARWLDKVNGNTYHSVRVTNNKNGETIVHPLTYGYGTSYEQTAQEIMLKAGWIPAKYKGKWYLYERENKYPIHWIVTDGLLRDCVANGTL